MLTPDQLRELEEMRSLDGHRPGCQRRMRWASGDAVAFEAYQIPAWVLFLFWAGLATLLIIYLFLYEVVPDSRQEGNPVSVQGRSP